MNAGKGGLGGRLPLRLLVRFGGALLVTTAAGLTFATLIMRAPATDVQYLALILAGAGTLSLLAGAAAVRVLSHRSTGLRVLLAGMYGAGLAVTLINVMAASLLMFLSVHDLLLLVLVLSVATVLSLLFGFTVTGAVVADLSRLAGAAHRLAAGDLETRAALHGSDEVAQLGSAFDAMAERLQASIERERTQELARREMVAAVSHDLRTPLTTVRAMVEALADGVVTEPEGVQRYLGLIRSEVQHLSRLIDDLFELSQIDSGALRLERTPISLPELIAETVEAYVAPARARAIALEQEHERDGLIVQADPSRLMRVLRNLLDNALRYTPPGGRIRVGTWRDGDVAHVTVHDSGPGIPPTDAERVFERFHRGAPARSRQERQHVGAGLGLTIARGLVQAHGGRIWMESGEGGAGSGASFHFTLPLAPC